MTRLSSDISKTPEIGLPVMARDPTSAVMPNIRNARKAMATTPEMLERIRRKVFIVLISLSFRSGRFAIAAT